MSLAADYYIDGGAGNDQNPGSLSSPWKTITKANTQLQPGDTVYIRKGTYQETINPQNSGSSGKYITYSVYNDEEVIITNVYDGADLRAKHYIVLDGLKIIDVDHYWVNMRENGGATHNIIKNCYMETARGWGGIYMRAGCDYNQILNNTLVATCTTDGVGGPDDTIDCYGSSYNLFENNQFQYATHISLNFESRGYPTRYNIVRNNSFYNPWHTAIGAVEEGVEHTLIENNTIFDSGEEAASNWCGSERDRTEFAREDHNAIQINSSRAIIRNNVLINNGKTVFAAFSGDLCVDNRFYHNTSYKDYRGSWLADNSVGTILKNNIYSENILYAVKSISGNDIINNNAYLGSISGGTTSDNINVSPDFLDPVNRDLHLKDTSPMIDAGAFLTTTTTSGSGVNIPVQDASYFMNGWGIIEGDVIQLQNQTQTATVVAVSNNVITIDRELSWNSNTGVSLAYQGNAPDMGAFEYSSELITVLDPPNNLRILE
jgi:hypothetical protein